jgi:drug/metabolite transporter (DMT)-like permease
VFLGQRSISLDHIEFSLLIVVATFSYGININMVAHRLQDVNPLQVATVSLAFMTIPTILVLLLGGFFKLDFTDIHLRYAVAESAGLGIVGSAIATAMFYVLVQRAGGLFASLVTYGIPFIALLWDIIDGKDIPWYEYLCLGIILCGVYLANKPDRDIPPEEDAAIKTIVED